MYGTPSFALSQAMIDSAHPGTKHAGKAVDTGTLSSKTSARVDGNPKPPYGMHPMPWESLPLRLLPRLMHPCMYSLSLIV
jgi:hypothetical protein